jgi:hypothetical protein
VVGQLGEADGLFFQVGLAGKGFAHALSEFALDKLICVSVTTDLILNNRFVNV